MVVLVAGAGLAFWLAPREADEAPAAVGERTETESQDGATLTAPVPRPAPGARPTGAMVLPDGSRVPALNGVEVEVALTWPAGRPFSPIVDKTPSPTGLWWYVHADGTRSTTQFFERDDGTREPVATVFAPTAPASPLRR
jgi:hypothetical protein